MYFLQSRPFLLFAALLIIISFTGCKDDNPSGPSGNKPTIVSFTANPSTISSTGDSVKLSWKVTGANSLSIDQGVGTVTPKDSGSITVFVSAQTTFTLTATNSGGNVNATAAVNATQTKNISGYVKDPDGVPIAGATVSIKGKSPVVSGADGGFSFTDVTVPYEARLILSNQQTAIIYQGLTRSDPVLLYLFSTTPDKSAAISGTVPPAAGKTTIVFFISGSKSWATLANPATGAYSLTCSWRGEDVSFTGKLQVLRWTLSSNLPLDYDAYGTKNFTITSGGTFNNQNFITADITNPAEQNISGTIISPSASQTIQNKQLSLSFGNAYITIAEEMGANLTSNFSYKVPDIAGITFDVSAYTSDGFKGANFRKKGITGGTSGINISIPEAPQLNLPINNGTSIDTTTQFLWSGGTGVNLISILPDVGPAPKFYIMTSSNDCFIANLNPQGMGMPSNKVYTWRVIRVTPMPTLDDAASDMFMPVYTGHSGDVGISFSQEFKFTTH